MEKILLGAPSPNEFCKTRFEFNGSPNMDFENRVGHKKNGDGVGGEAQLLCIVIVEFLVFS